MLEKHLSFKFIIKFLHFIIKIQNKLSIYKIDNSSKSLMYWEI